jgi:gamma-glutamyltranspeptidase/glutathione hydrolase
MRGVVAGGSPQTVAAGRMILKAGGNAVDAIVAATFASHVGEIMLSSPAGGGYAMVYEPGKEPVLYDFFCSVPAAQPHDEIDFDAVTVVYESGTSIYHLGRASAAVPGEIAGLATLLEERGTMPIQQVLQPAIRFARKGFILNDFQAYLIQLVDVIFEYDDSCLSLFAPQGKWLKAGDRYVNENLARTYEEIAETGWQSMYSGNLAQKIVADQQQFGGLLAANDLVNYRVTKRQPIEIKYRENTVFLNPPPSAGGILIAYALKLLERTTFDDCTHGDIQHAALLAEIARQTSIVRNRDQPAGLVTPSLWRDWLSSAQLDMDWQEVVDVRSNKRLRPGAAESPTHNSTTHISVIDESGLAVGLTTTPGETAGFVVGETGILMNNMLGEDELNPDGFHQHPPGVRLPSMMAPTILVNSDGAITVTGSGGAARLRGAIFQVINNLVDWQLSLHQAVNVPRLHLDIDTLQFEGGYDPDTVNSLKARGYSVNFWRDRAFYFGGTHTAQRDSDGNFDGVGDSRRGGLVSIFDE